MRHGRVLLYFINGDHISLHGGSAKLAQPELQMANPVCSDLCYHSDGMQRLEQEVGRSMGALIVVLCKWLC